MSDTQLAAGNIDGSYVDGSYVDWPAIFAGTVVAVAIGLLLTTFGAALGLSSITLDGTDPSSTFELVLTALWLVLTLIASYLAGGYIAGRMRRRVDTATRDEVTARDGINGLVVWGLGSVLSAILLTNALSLAATTAGNVASGVGAVAQGAASAIDTGPVDPMAYLSGQMMRPAQVQPGAADPAEVAGQVGGIMANIVASGEISDADRAYLVSAVSANTNLSEQEAAARVDQGVVKAQETRQAAIDATRTARNAAILSAFVLAAASLIAAVASYAGAVHGGRHRDEGRIFGGLRYHG